jgi:hypothetical protein
MGSPQSARAKPGRERHDPIVQGIITIIVGVGGCVGYFYLANLVLDRLVTRLNIFCENGRSVEDRLRRTLWRRLDCVVVMRLGEPAFPPDRGAIPATVSAGLWYCIGFVVLESAPSGRRVGMRSLAVM